MKEKIWQVTNFLSNWTKFYRNKSNLKEKQYQTILNSFESIINDYESKLKELQSINSVYSEIIDKQKEFFIDDEKIIQFELADDMFNLFLVNEVLDEIKNSPKRKEILRTYINTQIYSKIRIINYQDAELKVLKAKLDNLQVIFDYLEIPINYITDPVSYFKGNLPINFNNKDFQLKYIKKLVQENLLLEKSIEELLRRSYAYCMAEIDCYNVDAKIDKIILPEKVYKEIKKIQTDIDHIL